MEAIFAYNELRLVKPEIKRRMNAESDRLGYFMKKMTAPMQSTAGFEPVKGSQLVSADPAGEVTPLDSEPEYSDEQFMADLKKARVPLTVLADKARKSLLEGNARKFPG